MTDYKVMSAAGVTRNYFDAHADVEEEGGLKLTKGSTTLLAYFPRGQWSWVEMVLPDKPVKPTRDPAGLKARTRKATITQGQADAIVRRVKRG